MLAERRSGAPVPAPAPAAPAPEAAAPPVQPAAAGAAPTVAAPAAATSKHEGPESIRVRVDLLARVMNSASELVLSRNQLLSMLDRHVRDIPGLPPVLQHLDRTVSELQERAMQTRMQPLDSLFMKFPRVVRDLRGRCPRTST